MSENNFYNNFPDIPEYECKIGEVSSLTGISVKMLRYYDKVNLCKPSYIDPDSGYRYYTKSEITLLIIIKEMLQHGFTSPEIKELFENKDIEIIKEIYSAKKIEIEDKIKFLNNVKMRIDKQLEILDTYINSIDGNKDGYFIKEIEQRKFISLELNTTISPEIINMLINAAQKAATSFNIKLIEPYLLVVKNIDINIDINTKASKLNDIKYNIVACATINDKLVNIPDESSFITILSAGKYITTTFEGQVDGGSNLIHYKNMIEWMNKNNYKILSDPIFLYVNSLRHMIEKKKAIIELQILTEKMS